MNRTLPVRIIALAIVACASPIAVWADLSENTILQTGSALNLDTGAVASSGGDTDPHTATASHVACSSRPTLSVRPRQSSSADMPAQPIATSHCP